MYSIIAENLIVKRGIKVILNEINIRIKSKEHTILFGLNGSGKTSLLASISGYMGITSGNVFLLGQKITNENCLELRKQIGFVSNSYFDRCFKKENVINIVLSGLHGELAERWDVTSKDVRRAKHLLKSFGILEKSAYPYDLLSRGQQQRVLIARALMVPPKILLLDEPCTGLDVLSRQYFLNSIKNIANESDATIVCATHYNEEILPFFTKAILLKKGTIIMQDTLDKVFTSENISNFFEVETNCQFKDEMIRMEINQKLSLPQELWN